MTGLLDRLIVAGLCAFWRALVWALWTVGPLTDGEPVGPFTTEGTRER